MRVLVDDRVGAAGRDSFELAGPRRRIACDPARLRAGVLTSGGLCPGLNDVIRAVVMGLHFHYGVAEDRILGIPNGYAGLMDPDSAIHPLDLARVKDIHRSGGSALGSARIEPDVPRIVDRLQQLGLDQLYCIGGDGTLRGAHAIHLEAARRGWPLLVVGIPKTIDNDIGWVDRTFGYETAVELAREAVHAAHVEAEAAQNGVGLVKLMGRDSGFIAAGAAIAAGEANCCLVPELPFDLDGSHGLLAWLEERLRQRGHAVIVVAEGAGQDLMPTATERRDASGNRLHQDIGLFLKDAIQTRFKTRNRAVNLKYIDPSYLVRAHAATADDAILCQQYGHLAVHAAMAGRGDCMVGSWHGSFTHVPISLATATRKGIEPDGPLWAAVLESTGQPHFRH